MKRTTTLLLSLALATAAMAIPAKRQQVTLTRPDGTTVTAYVMGDEHFHYFQDVNTNQILFLNADGQCYTPSAAELNMRQQYASQRAEKANAARMRAPRRADVDRTVDRTPFDLHGKRKALLILVDFFDQPMTWTREDIEAQVNEVGYKGNTCYGSVHDYFYDQSYGQFDLSFDVVGPITVSKKASYYGANDRYGNDLYPGTMVAEACEQAYEQGINFADYDWDGDGEAEMVVCVYSGYGEAQGAAATTIWPHQWTLTEALEYDDGPGRMEIGGTFIDRYLVLNELNGKSGKRLDGIGTFCHEYSHGLGLPDIYNTVGGSTFGMDDWSLMDSGCYNGDGYHPCAYTAYEKMYCGWLEPTELTTSCEIKDMKAITDEAEAYIIYNEANRNEYYLLQNIQQNDWNEYAPGHGMLIMHVDYVPEIWDFNTVNNDRNHRCCTIVPADNNTYTSATGLAGDPYPGTKKNTSLTDTSLPAATLYSRNADGRKFLGRPIENIAETFAGDKTQGTISFTFTGPTIEGIASELADPDLNSHNIYNLYGRITNKNMHNGITINGGRKEIK